MLRLYPEYPQANEKVAEMLAKMGMGQRGNSARC